MLSSWQSKDGSSRKNFSENRRRKKQKREGLRMRDLRKLSSEESKKKKLPKK